MTSKDTKKRRYPIIPPQIKAGHLGLRVSDYINYPSFIFHCPTCGTEQGRPGHGKKGACSRCGQEWIVWGNNLELICSYTHEVGHPSASAAVQAMHRKGKFGLAWYKCSFCSGFHIGRPDRDKRRAMHAKRGY